MYCNNSSNVMDVAEVGPSSPSLPEAGDGSAATPSKQTSEHQPPLTKKRKSGKSKADGIEEAILKTLNHMDQRRCQQQQPDEDEMFASSVTTVLQRLSNHYKAVAKFHIQKILEFPEPAHVYRAQ